MPAMNGSLGSHPTYNGQSLPFAGTIANNLPTNESLLIVECNGVPTGFSFSVAPKGGPAGTTIAALPPTPAQLRVAAESIAGTIAMPGVSIKANPPVGAGTVHLDTWFYTAGYAGGPIAQTRNALGATIEIDATPTSYVWDFGDGSAPLTTTSLGVPWQASFRPNTTQADCNFDGTPIANGNPTIAGSVTHCWTQNNSAGVTVSLTFNFAVSYRVNGGAPIALAPITRTATLTYPVQNIDSVITARG